ncbi:D-hexose-6-phosphate mutarotase [Neorhizobium sp. NCHU2750]|uniref:D-hexose-6-phosphate mutarotase n=1 Tax=Neorhizobium sp. NCHU2750 TaxID=1825976 RepID=UPI000EB778BF|nr:aldose epimerase [Neorhizobium sp. NCHU2750]
MSSVIPDPDVMRSTSPGGASAAVLHHGAQLASWLSADGMENIYLSERADFSPGSAVRGGAPVCFPQFSTLGSLPLHGFVRNHAWTPVSTGADDAAVTRLRLADTPETLAIWPHPFEAEIQVIVADDGIEIALTAKNTGTAAFTFTAALHTYFRVKAIEDVTITGLKGIRYLDKLKDNIIVTEADEKLSIDRPLDRVYYQTTGERIVEEGRRKLVISTEGMPDTVVWNPGAERCATIADLPDDAWRHFVCVEAAVVDQPISLAPGATWRGVQRVKVIAT